MRHPPRQLLLTLCLVLSVAACKQDESPGQTSSKQESADAVGGYGSALDCLCADLLPVAARPEYPRLADVTDPRQIACAYVSNVTQTTGQGSVTVRVRPAAAKTAAEAVFASLSAGFVKVTDKQQKQFSSGALISAIAESSQGPARISVMRTASSLVIDTVEYRSDGQFATSTGTKFVQAASQTASSACL